MNGQMKERIAISMINDNSGHSEAKVGMHIV